jgi:hypothetical protein
MHGILNIKLVNVLFTSDSIETVKYSQHQHHTDKHAECCNAVVSIPSVNIILKLYRSNIDQLYDIRIFSKTAPDRL